MRILLASAAAAFAFAATPAFAQYGGSPQQQVDGAPGEAAEAPQGDEGENRYVDVPSYEDAEDVAVAGKLQDGEDYAAVDIDADLDADVDFDRDDAGQVEPGEAYEGVADEDEAAPAEQGGTWQGEDGRAYCRRSDGTTGLVVGGGAGALVGRGIDGGRNRGAGTIIGAIAGAIIGTAVERSATEQSCR